MGLGGRCRDAGGPILGGVLLDNLGWQWIFFVNVPVGVVGFLLAWRLVPSLPTNNHKFDMIGVALSAIGLFCIVFGLQEGNSYDWDARAWGLIAGGLVVMGVFVWWQKVTATSRWYRWACSRTATSPSPTSVSPRWASPSPV